MTINKQGKYRLYEALFKLITIDYHNIGRTDLVHKRQAKNASNKLECLANKDFKSKEDGAKLIQFKKFVILPINKQKRKVVKTEWWESL